jgi:hypothetical protein
MKSGDEIQVKVLEVSTDVVKYKKWDNLEGPTYSINKTEIFMIKYKNGTKDVFKIDSQPQQVTTNNTQSVDLLNQAKAYMEEIIRTESEGAIILKDFKKKNGVIENGFGAQRYKFEYELTIEAQRDFWKTSEDAALFKDWYWTNFKVVNHGSKGGWDDWGHTYRFYSQGSQVLIKGVLPFEKTDNGWRVTDINMFSKGFKNKSSTELSANNDKTSEIKPGYVGEYLNGKKNGRGKMVYKDGSSYDGEWKDDMYNGYGTIKWSNGNSYVGYLVDNQMQGRGTLTHLRTDGTVIISEGTFVPGKIYNGTRTTPDGKKYITIVTDGVAGEEKFQP